MAHWENYMNNFNMPAILYSILYLIIISKVIFLSSVKPVYSWKLKNSPEPKFYFLNCFILILGCSLVHTEPRKGDGGRKKSVVETKLVQSHCPHSWTHGLWGPFTPSLRGLRVVPLSNQKVHNSSPANFLIPLYTLSVSQHFCRLCRR